ncbi:hypothetical protein N7E02_14160 [Aliirhizobium terrae]|nr:hypothetical protein [Rhizobium sp. CC-CFT758]WJH41504.1 hypothetical protein N7E02_14160 [Rhizobium sp. CC-CFT758]
MAEAFDQSALRVQPIEPLGRRKPQQAVPVLTDMQYGGCRVIELEVTELARLFVESIKQLVGADPHRALAIFEHGIDVDAAQATGIIAIMGKNTKIVAVIAVCAMLRPQPDIAAIVLDDLAYTGLRQALSERDLAELNIRFRP